MLQIIWLPAAAAAFTGSLRAMIPCARVKPASMSAVGLHVYEPDASSELTQYLEKRRTPLPSSFDEAPKLAHSIAIELDEALDGEPLRLLDGAKSIGLTFIISEAEGLDASEACLSALGAPESAAISSRDFDADRLTGFCCSGAPGSDTEAPSITLISGERVAGLQAAPGALQAIRDATAVLADELEQHFEFTVTDQSGALAPVVYGGRAPDGCIVGVIGMR